MLRGNHQFQTHVALLLLAAVLRLAACIQWSGDLSRDPDAYAAYAERLAATGRFIAPDGHPTAFRPPLYPLILAALETIGPVWGVAVLHVALGVATVALTVSLGRRFDLGAWSLLAGLVVACDPLLLRYTPQVMTEATCTFLAVLVLWLAAERRQFLLGVAFGLATLSRPTFWAFGALVAVAWTWRTFQAWRAERFLQNRAVRFPQGPSPFPLSLGRGVRGEGRSCGFVRRFARSVAFRSRPGAAVVVKRHPSPPAPLPRGEGGIVRTSSASPTCQRGIIVRDALLVVAGVILVVTPWVVRNTVALGRPMLTTTHGGYTLLLANNPVFWNEVVDGPPGSTWSGESLAAWQQSLEVAMADAGIATDDELARDRWMKDRAIGNILNSPGLFLRSAVYRLLRFWDVAPTAAALPRPVRWSVTAFYVVVFGLAIAGTARIARAALRRLVSRKIVRAATVRERLRTWVRRLTLPDGRGSEGEVIGQPREERPASWLPALLLILAFTAVHAVYWTDTRMRAPLVPAVALLAARAFMKGPDGGEGEAPAEPHGPCAFRDDERRPGKNSLSERD